MQSSHASPPKSLTSSQVVFVIIAFLVTGVTIVEAPVVTWILLGSLIGLFMLQFPPYVWVSSAVLAASFSRLLVATGFVPAGINYLHFPLALTAAVVATTGGACLHSVARSTAISCGALLFFSFVSWALNGGEFLRPPLNWLVFLEPFLIVYALVRTPPPVDKQKLLWNLALAIPIVQFPLALWQGLTGGWGDTVQGTFVGMGAGHHVAGGVALIGSLICVARGLSAAAFKGRLAWLLGGALLFVVPILSDAKQNIAAFLPALMLLMIIFRIPWTRLVMALPILTLVVLLAFSYYLPLQAVTSLTTINRGILAKKQGFSIIASKLSDNPGGWLFGLGPGNSISRVALMGLEAYGKSDSPIALLGWSAAPTTREIWAMGYQSWLFYGSSVWSGISSWLGLFGDLGLIGLGIYLWMSWQLWRNLKGPHKWEASVAKGVLIMVGILGVMYSWLEEPGFTLIAALIVGLGLIAREGRNGSVQNLGRPQLIPAAWR